MTTKLVSRKYRSKRWTTIKINFIFQIKLTHETNDSADEEAPASNYMEYTKRFISKN